jgi:hypothetical protein
MYLDLERKSIKKYQVGSCKWREELVCLLYYLIFYFNVIMVGKVLLYLLVLSFFFLFSS